VYSDGSVVGGDDDGDSNAGSGVSSGNC